METVPLSAPGDILWLGGIATSVVCMSVQIFLYVVLPSSRKLDQMILSHLTIARLVNVIVNYIQVSLQIEDLAVLCAHVTLGMHLMTDSAITFWMFIFTKNLYDKVIQVFTLRDTNFVVLSVFIWIITIPVGIVCPLVFSVDYKYCNIFYLTYVILKALILLVNFLLFCRIFWVIINIKSDRDLKSLLKTSVVTLILLLITSLQALVELMFSDVTSYFLLLISKRNLGYAFKVISAYQVIAITAIFVMLSRDAQHNSITKALALRLKKSIP